MKKLASIFFKYRSYTPIPFVVIMLVYVNATVYSLVTGFLIAVIGELIRLWGVNWAGSETRTTGEVGGTFLIVKGPFAHVRNPLYLGNILIYIGLGVMSYALFPYLQIFALIFFSIQYYLIVKVEEEYLLKTFGDDFKDYVKNVPRFIPRLNRYENDQIKQPTFKLHAGLKSEKRSLQAMFGVSLLIIAVWLVKTNDLL
jgi:protein-S-isoprenylcysteine O-methyltransferase Ste14